MSARPTLARLGLPPLVAGLRAWTRLHDAHVRAAVELLIGHERWLRRPEFRRACLHLDDTGEVWINFRAAGEALAAGEFAASSSTERAVLELAVALGVDRYRFTAMDPTNSAPIVRAVTAALGLPPTTNTTTSSSASSSSASSSSAQSSSSSSSSCAAPFGGGAR